MRHDCVLAAQLESVSEGNDGAGVEESSADAAAGPKPTTEARRHGGDRVIARDRVIWWSEPKTYFTAKDAKGATEIGRQKLTADQG